MRGLVRCQIMEYKRVNGVKVDVRDFLSEKSRFDITNRAKDFICDLSIASPEKILQWVADHIHYKSEVSDYWQTIGETLSSGIGDCEDGAILLANLMLFAGLPYYKVLVTVFNPSPAHVVVIYDGKLFDWTNPSLRTVPSSWNFWYCFNSHNSYTTKEKAATWKK